jgi:hypothetical protein
MRATPRWTAAIRPGAAGGAAGPSGSPAPALIENAGLGLVEQVSDDATRSTGRQLRWAHEGRPDGAPQWLFLGGASGRGWPGDITVTLVGSTPLARLVPAVLGVA